MNEFIDLDCLLAVGRHVDLVVAWRDGHAHDFAAFTACAAAWRTAFTGIEGDRVALYFEDSAEFAAALFGAWHAGKEVVLPADALPDTWRRLEGIVVAMAGDHEFSPSVPRVRRLDSAPMLPWPTLDTDRVAVQVFTSGSTGRPELIPKRLEQLTAEVRALNACFEARVGRGCVHASVTHQHMYGLPFRVLWPLASGRPFAAQRTVFPEDMLRAMATTPDGVLITSPAHLKRLPEHFDWAPARQCLSALFSSGGPLPEKALPLCDRVFGMRPIEIYGSSETGAVAWRQRADTDDSPWQALPGMQVRINGEHLDLKASWLSAADWQGGADRVAARTGGFALLGRRDRIVKIEENRVSLTAIEHAVCASGLVAEARTLLLPGERARIGVAVVPNPDGWQVEKHEGRRALADRLRAAIEDSVEPVAVPRYWRFSWTLPANATGKITEATLLSLFDPRRPHARRIRSSRRHR